MTAKTFGKRSPAIAAPVRREAPVANPVTTPEPPPIAEPQASAVAEAPELSVDEELRRWKEERSQTLFTRLPWKQFSLFASISFGVASFVLPDDVNDAVDYLLWGLSLITFAIWVSGFFNRKPEPASR